MYITIDGPEATGKSTTVAALVTRMRAAGYAVLQTKEPGSGHSRICAQIRQLILAGDETIDPTAELLLFLADRVQHLNRVVLPALQRGEVVVSDRSGVTGLVYALAGAEQSRHPAIQDLWRHGQVLWPDTVYLSHADADWSAEQLASRGHLDQIELRGAEYHATVRSLYDRCRLDPGWLGSPEGIAIRLLPAAGQNTTDEIVDWIMETI